MALIKIDNNKCRDVLECGLCMKVCPTAVFVARPRTVRKFYETPGNEYELRPHYEAQCILCMECSEKCPNNAIEVVIG